MWFQWKKYDEPREKSLDTYVVSADKTGLRKLTEEEAKDVPPLNADWSKNKKRAVFADGGDLYLYDSGTGKRRNLTRTSEAETNPRFTRDQEHITFTRAGNLYLLSLDEGSLIQMTDIQPAGAAPGTAPAGGAGGRGGQGQFQGRGGAAATSASAEQRGTESQEYVKKEERDLLDIIKRRAAKREEDEARRKKENPRKPFSLQARQTVTNLQLSPDQKTVIAMVSEAGEGSKTSIVPNFVTESTYVEDIPGRGLVGDNQARTRIALIDVATGEVRWVDHGQKPVAKDPASPSAPPAAPEPGQGQGPGPRRTPPPTERAVQLFPPLWSDDGTRAVLLGRASDNKDRWIFALDPATGKTRVLVSDHDDAWINTFGGGPGGFGSANMGWMKDDRSIYFLSERSGYSHLYVVSYDGGEPRALTSGKWEVAGVQLSEDKTRFFLTTTEPDPSDRHFFVMPASGGERTRVTAAPGHHQAFVSPDEKKLAVIYSFTTKPPELYIQDLQPGAKPEQVTNSPAPDFWNYPWTDAPIVQVPARDGATVPGRMYKPKNWKAGGPGVIFVHGAGYAQNIHRGWSSNPQVNLFNHFLMEHGYLVMDLDYRASAGYGRDWRAAIYRHMGGQDLDDQVDCARWMAKEQGVDPRRIGIYGGSYGGFMTLMAMFTQPDVFAAGAALRPVTDWAHYNHGYTSNILNTPQKDAEAYRQSSPIYFAQNLKGALLICHGMVDTNVFFQDSVRLVQRLIELRKENWEFAVYPVEDHGFLEPTSWADEYKRIFKLFEANLKKPPETSGRVAKKAGA
jgi:dipeptidyl aminopeptidase/acylaminoacyl peptidase